VYQVPDTKENPICLDNLSCSFFADAFFLRDCGYYDRAAEARPDPLASVHEKEPARSEAAELSQNSLLSKLIIFPDGLAKS